MEPLIATLSEAVVKVAAAVSAIFLATVARSPKLSVCCLVLACVFIALAVGEGI